MPIVCAAGGVAFDATFPAIDWWSQSSRWPLALQVACLTVGMPDAGRLKDDRGVLGADGGDTAEACCGTASTEKPLIRQTPSI